MRKRAPKIGSMCLNKIPYISKESALSELNWWVVQAIQTYGKKPTANLQPYKCPFCDKWHLGNKKR